MYLFTTLGDNCKVITFTSVSDSSSMWNIDFWRHSIFSLLSSMDFQCVLGWVNDYFFVFVDLMFKMAIAWGAWLA